ncbi:ZNT2 protein, partial [Eudromia elegans]|nr:ZNT2 protein [Eudromia elegans]
LWVSTRLPTRTMSFGWHRAETLGALASVLSIWLVTAVLVYLAAARILSGDYEIEARAMLATSAGAVAVNLVMAYVLRQPGHGHNPAYERLDGGKGARALPGSTSVRAAFVHVVGDLLQSIGVLVAATVIYFKPQCKVADPISTLLFSLFVLGSTSAILRDVFRVLMEGAPRGTEPGAVEAALLAVDGVQGVHELHVWALTPGLPVVAAHVAVGEWRCPCPPSRLPSGRLLSALPAGTSVDAEAVLRAATAELHARFGLASCTLQLEPCGNGTA